MPGAFELLGLLAIPALVAAGVTVAFRFGCPQVAARYGLGAATAVGFLVGALVYPERLPLLPVRHWEWLPYLGVIAAFFGGVSTASGVQIWERAIIYLLLGGIAAWLLAPTWDTLRPQRPLMIPLVGLYLAALCGGLLLLPARMRGTLFVGLLTLSSIAVAVAITSESSLRLGEVALRVPAAIAGWRIVHAVWKWHSAPPELGFATCGLIAVYAVLTGGTSFAAAIELTEPRYVLLLFPAAPLMLWLFVWGPLSRLHGVFAITAQTVAVALVPLAVLIWLLINSEPNEWGY